ncbi:MAG: hypothetical protein EOO61_10400, partial [Hymenobacter sp.]
MESETVVAEGTVYEYPKLLQLKHDNRVIVWALADDDENHQHSFLGVVVAKGASEHRWHVVGHFSPWAKEAFEPARRTTVNLT